MIRHKSLFGKVAILSLTFLVLASAIAACGGGAAPASAPTQNTATSNPAILRVGWPGSPDTLNPGTGILAEAYTVYALVYDTLFTLQLDGTYKLSAAESYAVSDNGKVWTFKMPTGVKFHDGSHRWLSIDERGQLYFNATSRFDSNRWQNFARSTAGS